MSKQSWKITAEVCLRCADMSICEHGHLGSHAHTLRNGQATDCAELDANRRSSNPSRKVCVNIADHIPRHIKKVARSIGYTLWLNGDSHWLGLEKILKSKLDQQQREALAYMALKTLRNNAAKSISEDVLGTGAVQPIASLFNHLDEALFWADFALPEELDAYCLASFERMEAARQEAFLEYVKGGK